MNGVRQSLGDKLRGWDYESETSFELQPSFDVEEVLRTAQVDSTEDLAIVLLLDCPAVGERWHGAYLLSAYLDSDMSALEVAGPAGHLADAVRLSAHLVLWERRSASSGSATRPGSRLAWSKVQTVSLEGDGSRFPTEEVSFKALGLENAAWTVRASFTDMSDSFMSTVRLLINKDHPSSDMLLEQGPHHALAHSTLRMDVARQLLLGVAADRESFPAGSDDWEDGSVGAVMSGLTTTFMRMDLVSALNLARSDPFKFERKIQEGFDFMEVE
jgi:hypothetical protein